MSDDLDMKAMGKRLRSARVAKKLKQNVLAKMLGIDPTRYHNWEAGRATMPPEFAVKFCGFTGATTDYIYRGDVASLPTALFNAVNETTVESDEEQSGAA